MNPGLHAAPWPKAARARGRRAAAVLALWAGSGMPPEAQGQTFRAEGADTGAGLGARWVAQGGTGVATADDVHAITFNPAGLAAVSGPQVSVSRQADARLRPMNFLGAAWPLPHRGALRATLAAAYYPRIHARASGAFDDGDFESLFLRYLLPGISGTFDGDIDTKTKSYRLGLGLAAGDEAPWSLGAYVERIDCRSDFCGVHATSNGFTTQSTGAVATGVGLGQRWRWSPALTLGASLADLRTRLAVRSTTTDAAGTRTTREAAAFPRKLAVGVGWQATPVWRLAADAEVMRGRYGRSEIDLQILRLGAERSGRPWSWRAGAVAPLRIFSTESGSLKAPFPFGPTLGVGWQQGPWQLDMAVYAHAVMSMHKDRAHPAADLSLSVAF